MKKIKVGFLRNTTPSINSASKFLLKSSECEILYGEDRDLSTLESYFRFIKECDLIVVDKKHDYPLQVSGVINDCLSAGTLPITYEENEYFLYIAKEININPITIETLSNHTDVDEIRKCVEDFKEKTQKYMQSEHNKNNKRWKALMKYSRKKLFISYQGKKASGGFIDLYRFAINESRNGDYEVEILERKGCHKTEIKDGLPRHYVNIIEKMRIPHCTLWGAIRHKRPSSILFIMPTKRDVLFLILVKLLARKTTIFAIIHNSRNHVSSNNKLKSIAGMNFQEIFFRCSDVNVFLSSGVKDTWKSMKRAGVYPIPRITNEETSKDTSMAISTEKRVNLSVIGRWLPYKGLNILTESIGLLKEKGTLRITIAGEGYPANEMERLKNICKQMMVELNYIDSHISLNEAEDIVNDSDYVCFLYTKASQSGFMHLCKEIGKPIICTDVGSLKENLHNGGIGYCVPPEPIEIAKLFIKLTKIIDIPHYPENNRFASRLAITHLNY